MDNFTQFCYKAVYPPPPESMLFADEVRFKGLKHNNDLWEGWGRVTQGQAKDMSTMQKRGHSMEVSQHFCPSL